MQNFQCKNGIYLEPRLQEYIKKKMYYKKNRISPVVPLEQEFNISQEDVRRLKALKSGDNDIYNYKTQNKFLDEDEEPKFDFDPDEVYKSDIRYHRFAKKLKRDKDAMKQRHNHDGLDNDFENAFNPITNFWNENENSRLLDIENPPNESQRVNLLDSRDFNLEIDSKRNQPFTSKYRCDNPVQSQRMYTIPKQNQYDKHVNHVNRLPQYQPNMDFQNTYPVNRSNQSINHNPRLGHIIGNLDSYGNNQNSMNQMNTYQQMSKMDTDHKLVIPNVVSNGKKSLNSSSYRPVPCVGRSEGIRNIDAEGEMRDSLTTRASKSYGYNNPAEHYYDYISNDIQDPDHVVFNPGVSTRLDNHRVAKQYKREILN